MSFRHGARIKHTSTTTGAGALTLIAPSSNAFQGFNTVFGVGPVVVFYAISGTTYFEVGIGTFDNAGPSLTRTTVLASSNGGSAVSLPSATHDVFYWEPAAFPVQAITGTTSLGIADLFGFILFSGSLASSLNLPAIAGLPAGIGFPVLNIGTAVLTIDPNSSETINGATTLRLLPGQGAWVFYRDTATAQWAAIVSGETRLRNAQTGTTYGMAVTDHAKHVTFSNASAIAVSIAQATATTFADGWFSLVHNIGAGTVTITPTTSTINGAATLVLRTNQWAIITSDGANYRAMVGAAAGGKETMWIDAGAMIPNITNGPSAGNYETATNKNMYRSLDFDQTTSESSQFKIAMPKRWDKGTVTFIPFWTAGAGTGTVTWALSAVAVSNDDPIDVAFGTAQTSADTLIATGDVHVGPESSAITIAGTPADLDLILFKIARDTADTLSADARLLGIQLFWTSTAGDDN